MGVTEQEVRLGGAVVPLLAALMKTGEIKLTESEIERAFDLLYDSAGNQRQARQILSLTLESGGYFRLEPEGYEERMYLLKARPDL